MAKAVWYDPKDIAAFNSGKLAASTGKPRVPSLLQQSYNERAAFNDGWDTQNKASTRPKRRTPRPASLVW